MESNLLKFRFVVDASIRHFAKKFWLIFFASLIFCVPLVLSYILFWENQDVIQYFMFQRSNRDFEIASFVLTAVLVLVFLICKIFLFLTLHDDNPAVGKNLLKALRKLPGYIYLKIILLIKVFLWSLVFIIPGIVQLVYWSCAELVYLCEGRDVKSSFKESKRIILPYRNKYLDYLFYVFIFSYPFWYSMRVILKTFADYSKLKGFFLTGELFRHLIPLEILLVLSFFLVFYYELYKALSARAAGKVI